MSLILLLRNRRRRYDNIAGNCVKIHATISGNSFFDRLLARFQEICSTLDDFRIAGFVEFVQRATNSRAYKKILCMKLNTNHRMQKFEFLPIS